MFKLSKTLFKFLLIITLMCGHSLAQQSPQTELLLKIDLQAKKKWQHFIELQEDPKWVAEQSELGLYGVIFQKGWLNPKVARQIMPDKDSGYIVIDTITLGATMLSQLAILSGNILLTSHLPYLQAGRISQKVFTNIRKVESYQQALELTHFELAHIPTTREQLNQLTPGELISSISTSGFFSRVSLSFFELLNIALPGPMELGPKAKLQIKHSLKITIAKDKEDIAIISIKSVNDQIKGLGTGLGIYFEDLIDLPITIGINGQNGYSPMLFNLKKKKSKVTDIVFKVDLSKEKGQEAFLKFLEKDFTLLQDLAKLESSPVVLDIKKEGKITTREMSLGIDLILWRSGFRNISMDAKYITSMPGEKKFEYQEILVKKIKDRKGFSGKEKEILQFSTITPISKTTRESFVLDTLYFYSDTKTRGKELQEISKLLKSLGIPSGLPVKLDPKKKYGETQLEARVRFSADAIAIILDASDEEIWEALATAKGYSDPYIWRSKEARKSFLKKNYVRGHTDRLTYKRSTTGHLNRDQRRKMARLESYLEAKEVHLALLKIRETIELPKKSKKLLKYLKMKKLGFLLHKTMVNIAGFNRIMGQGYLRGTGLR